MVDLFFTLRKRPDSLLSSLSGSLAGAASALANCAPIKISFLSRTVLVNVRQVSKELPPLSQGRLCCLVILLLHPGLSGFRHASY